MLAAESPISSQIHAPKPGSRRPLQPKNIIIPSNPTTTTTTKPKKDQNAPTSTPTFHSNKENKPPPAAVLAFPIEAMDASLAEELSAVRQRLERLRLDRERTEKLLQERERVLHFQMSEIEERGEFQKELEIEVDRLYRLKQLKLACMRRSPIRSLREREMEKKNREAQFDQDAKAGENKEELADQSSSTGSPMKSFESTWTSTSASKSDTTSTSATALNTTSTSASSTSNSISTSRNSPIPLRLSLESASDK